MKKIAAIALTLIIFCSGMIFVLTSCSQKVDVESLLEYEQGTPAYSTELSLGEYSYDINLSLGTNTGEYAVRDGQALISGGALDGMLFEMKNGELKMKTSGFECILTEKDSPALYALFSGFAIEPNEFIGVTEDVDGVMTASFDGKYKYTVSTKKDTKCPIEISVRTDSGEYKIKFKKTE